jgi:L-asparaginase II
VHLLNDAWLNLYDVGVLVSNDTDLAQVMALVQNDCGKTVGLISPVFHKGRRLSEYLKRLADFQKSIRKTALRKAQLPSPISGTGLHRPKKWNTE